MNLLFSIIIPVYNCENYIERCLLSVTQQEVSGVEILVIDDGSTDRTKDIILDLQKKDTRIKYFFQKNGGVSSARNLGLEKASGEYIMFLDGDDRLPQGLVAKLLNVIIEENFDLLILDYLYVFTKAKKKSNIFQNLEIKNIKYMDKKQVIFSTLTSDELNFLGAKLYKSQIIKENKLKFDVTKETGEDLLFNLEYMDYTQKIIYYPKIAYYYYIRANSSCHRVDINKIIANLIEEKQLRESYANKYLDGYKWESMVDALYLKRIISPLWVYSTDRISYRKFIDVLDTIPFELRYNIKHLPLTFKPAAILLKGKCYKLLWQYFSLVRKIRFVSEKR